MFFHYVSLELTEGNVIDMNYMCMAINIIGLGAKNVLEETDLRTVVDCLRDDGVVVAPTDSTYGILGLRTSAIGRISRLKKRPHDKPYLQLIYDIDIIPKEIKLPVPSFYKLAKCYWPGPLTVEIGRAHV